jgi:imidazolonepropionase-like amidohydrolase
MYLQQEHKMTPRHDGRAGRCAVACRPGALLRSALLPVLVLAFSAAAAHAQFVEPPPPAAYALQNVTIVRADGTRSTGQTVIVRAGRIEAIGANVAVPRDALVLSGDSLHVYPGMIDGFGGIRWEFPRDTTNRANVRSWDPPRIVMGFTPSRRVVDFLNPTATELVEQRKRGVVAMAVHPSLTEPLMPGQGTLLLLRRDATAPQQLVVTPTLAPLLTLRGGRGVYPATSMAVQQWYRQTFMDAQRLQQVMQVASSDPRVVTPPPHDADMAIVQSVLRDGRVFFAADDAEDIRRVLRISREFGLQPVIVGGREAWRAADELRAANVPVLVNVDFQTPRRWKPDEKPDSTAAIDPAVIDPAVEREKRQFEEQYANAGKLAQAGVTFALVSGGRGDIRVGIRKAIEYGLSADDALRAVTTTPATLYGVPHTVRVETGMPATFVVADGALFDSSTRVRYTFVEGQLERGADARPPARETGTTPTAGDAPASNITNVAGTWQVRVTGPMGDQAFSMRLVQEGTTLTGTMESPQGSVPVTGRIEGERLALSTTLSMGTQSVQLNLTGSVTGNNAQGTIATPVGNMNWTATRTPDARP